MTDDTQVAAAAKGQGGKKSAKAAGAEGMDANAKIEGQISRMLVRAIWAQEWLAANPEAKPEQRKAAWLEARDAAFEKNLKPYRRAISSLARSGVVMSITEGAHPKAASEDDGSDA